jgi:uncharacterized protein with HEPN domain
MKKFISDHVETGITEIEAIYGFIKQLTFDEFSKDKKTINATIRSLEIIGEVAKKIPEEIRIKHKNINWISISNMRNKLAHDYLNVDLNIVWETINSELETLKNNLMQIRSELKE